MTSKELRVGNIVCRTLEETYERTITYEDIIYCSFKPENYSPIPLTEEWLLSFGFTHLFHPSDGYRRRNDFRCSVYEYQKDFNLTGKPIASGEYFIFHDVNYEYVANPLAGQVGQDNFIPSDNKTNDDFKLMLAHDTGNWHPEQCPYNTIEICKVKHVHQLQNLYYILTGIELTETS